MRLAVVIFLLSTLLALTFDASDCQVTLGSNGLKLLPPINLATIFRILKKTWNAFMYPKEKSTRRAKTKKAQSKKVQKRVGVATAKDDEGAAEESNEGNEKVLSGGEKLVLDELRIKVNLECHESQLDCHNMTMEQFTTNSNMTISEEEEKIIHKYRNSTKLDFPILEFIDSSSKELVKDTKTTPSFLPLPISSGAWLLAYIGLNAVLMALYIYLAGPYLLTGRTVKRIVDDEEDVNSNFDDPGVANMTDDSISSIGDQYMGYTTYGDSDMIMSYMLSDNDEGFDEGFDEGNEEGNDEGEEGDEDGGVGEEENEGETQYGSNFKVFNEGRVPSDGSDETGSGNGVGETRFSRDVEGEAATDRETKCMENLMCLKPAFGARALSASSLTLKIIEWIPGFDWVGSKFKGNIHRFGEAVRAGRKNDCERYFCPEGRTGATTVPKKEQSKQTHESNSNRVT